MKYYADNSATLFKQYHALDPEHVHAAWRHRLPEQPGLACDIGAGSGRDACWLADQGWDVIAVEPCANLREQAEQAAKERTFKSGGVTWLNDSLPELNKLRALDQRFQFILVSAVWMHLAPDQHARAMRIVSELLAPGGTLVISLRNGEDEHGRFHPVNAEEIIHHASNRALALILREDQVQDASRAGVSWDCLVFALPDDGTGSLPLLRHIIVNDNKAASYKLGLLRALIRIAESAPGMVTRRTDDFVEIPFGLVGLYWLKIYMPLVLRHNIIQTPRADHDARSGYGWATEHFYNLRSLSPYDLRIGAGFDPDTAPQVIGAIRDACRNIKSMPANYITYPGQNRQVFSCETRRVRHRDKHWQITRETLMAFGTFRIPAALWQSFSEYACWLEPAILNEWVNLMQSWNHQYDTSIYDRALQWDEGRRDTSKVRERVQALRTSGNPVSCVWTHTKISNDRYAVDHCFPWSRWFNNDLWNLLPATERANSAKGDKLPSAPLLQQSRAHILQWWQDAYLADSRLANRFFREAEASLPLLEVDTNQPALVFQAMQHQRTKLRSSQQLAEWWPAS